MPDSGHLFLAVGGFRTMLAQVVVLGNVCRDSGSGGAQKRAAEGETGNVLQNVGMFDGICRGFAPGERSVAGYQHAGDGKWVEILSAEAADDDSAGIADVGFGNLSGGEGFGDGNRAVEVVGMRGAETGDFSDGLGPGGGEL